MTRETLLQIILGADEWNDLQMLRYMTPKSQTVKITLPSGDIEELPGLRPRIWPWFAVPFAIALVYLCLKLS